jgi:hypothetical protein
MAIGPIDYSSLLTQLDVTPLLQGAELLQRNKQVERLRINDAADRAAAAQADQRKAAFRDAWKQVADKPSAEGYASLRGNFPEYVKEVGDAQAAFDATRNDVGRNVAFDIYGRLAAGGDDLVPQLDANLNRLTTANVPTTGFQTIRDLAASGKPEQMAAAKRIAAMIAGQYSGGNFGEVVNSLGRDTREAELHPDRVRKADADADYAENRARYAPVISKATVASKEASTANSRNLVANRERRAALTLASRQPRAAAPLQSPKVRVGEQTAVDGQGNKYVVRKGQWVKAQ